MKSHRLVGVTVAIVLVTALSASSAFAAKQQTVTVKLTTAGCPKSLKAAAGPITFKVTNDGAANVSEFEVMSGHRVLGEVENLAPDLTRSFTVTLESGTYRTYCPGGDTRERAKLVVSAPPTA
jgi:iron uptake system EfeUOB component EfeO/EfeM